MKLKQILKGIALIAGVLILSGCGGSNGTSGSTTSASAPTTGSCQAGQVGYVQTMYGCLPIAAQCGSSAALYNNQCVTGTVMSGVTAYATPALTCPAPLIAIPGYGCMQPAAQCSNTGAWVNNQCMNASGVMPAPAAPTLVIPNQNTIPTCQAGYLFTGVYGCQPTANTTQCPNMNATTPNAAFFNNQCIAAQPATVIPTCQAGYLYVGAAGCQLQVAACGSYAALVNGSCMNGITSVQVASCSVGTVFTAYGCLPTNPQVCRNPMMGWAAATNSCYPVYSSRGNNGQYNNYQNGNNNGGGNGGGFSWGIRFGI